MSEKDSREVELVRQAAELDDVELTRYADQWPVPGTRAERRARRLVLGWFLLAVLAGLGALGVYLVWPWRYAPASDQGHILFQLYTPLLGTSLGLALLGVSFGLVTYTHRFLPKEQAVQRRHDEPSPETDQAATAAILNDARRRAGLTRRSWLVKALGAGTGAGGLAVGVVAVGGFVRDPWDEPESPESRVHTRWYSPGGEKVFLRLDTGEPERVVLARPGDLAPGGSAAVVPFRESDRGNPERLRKALRWADSPATLFRLRPGPFPAPEAGEGPRYGDFVAYSRICTHLGCPVTMYEQNTDRLVCPCHQSMFDLRAGAKPVFGPAVRPLPRLPITVDESGHFVATGDFTAPIGPSFWELG